MQAKVPFEKKFIEVLGRQMSYVEAGEGDPIVFLHGNPTSSYLWRDVMTELSGRGRLIAPDLIGMGHSDKLLEHGPRAYRFVEQRGFIDQFLRGVAATEDVTFVLHDWGSALGFDWAHRHPESVAGIVHMVSIVRPFAWDEWPEATADFVRALRSPAGEEMVLERNLFVEQALPGGILRDLSDEEMEIYRAPFLERGEGRRPTLTWPRELPIDGTPTDVSEIVAAYATWLESADVPKLFINGDPGGLLTGAARDFCRTWPNQMEVTVPGRHYLPEDSGAAIGRAISAWLDARGVD